MTVNNLGPITANAVTARPARAGAYGATNTWWKACSSPTAQDGTVLDADQFNDALAQFRTAFTSAGIVIDNADDMLWRAIQAGFISYFIRNDVTYTVGPAGGDNYANLTAALDFLKDKWIVDTATVTLALDAGFVSYGTDILVDHPQSDRIKIIGANMLAAAPSQSAFVANGSSGGTLTADAATNLTMLRTKFATEIRFTGGHGLVFTRGAKLGLLKNVLVTGSGSGSGLYAQRGSGFDFDTVGVASFSSNWILEFDSYVNGSTGYSVGASGNGLSVRNASAFVATVPFVIAQSSSYGGEVTYSSSITFNGGSAGEPPIVKGAGVHGWALWGGSELYAYYCAATRIAQNGFWINGGTVVASNGFATFCGSDGYQCGSNSYIAADATTANNNSGTDYKAAFGSIIYVAGYVGSPTFSPALNMSGNGDALIST